MQVRRYQDLVVWQKAEKLALESYRIAAAFPPYERYGMASQLRRAAMSIYLNIAEGHGRTHRADFARQVSIARGSTNEVEALLGFAVKLGYATATEVTHARGLCDEISRMLTQLKRALAT